MHCGLELESAMMRFVGSSCRSAARTLWARIQSTHLEMVFR